MRSDSSRRLVEEEERFREGANGFGWVLGRNHTHSLSVSLSLCAVWFLLAVVVVVKGRERKCVSHNAPSVKERSEANMSATCAHVNEERAGRLALQQHAVPQCLQSNGTSFHVRLRIWHQRTPLSTPREIPPRGRELERERFVSDAEAQWVNLYIYSRWKDIPNQIGALTCTSKAARAAVRSRLKYVT